MIIGDPSRFAIESEITQAYQSLGQRALGLFVIHVGGRRYGVFEPNASLLACSFSEVQRRIQNRGDHAAPFASFDAGAIAGAYRNAIYAEEQQESYFDISINDFCHLLASRQICWAPDGDEAFDDGSYVLQFDVGDRVRLIAFKSAGYSYDPRTLNDVWLPADDFYDILQSWHGAFEAEWLAFPKTPISDAWLGGD